MGIFTTRTAQKYRAFNTANAALSHDSTDISDAACAKVPFDFGDCLSASFQFVWKNLTGTLNATASLYCSDNGEDWDIKSDANGNPMTITISTANGNNVFSLNLVISEEFYKCVYTPNGVTGGTIDGYVFGK